MLTQAKESGQISEADWKEANNRYKTCLSENGHKVELVYEGSRVLIMEEGSPGMSAQDMQASGQERSKDDLECYGKTSAFINEVYTYLNGGSDKPDGDTTQRAVLTCLIDRKLVPANTTYDEFVADLEQTTENSSLRMAKTTPTRSDNAGSRTRGSFGRRLSVPYVSGRTEAEAKAKELLHVGQYPRSRRDALVRSVADARYGRSSDRRAEPAAAPPSH